MPADSLIIRRPDDWHVHLRDGPLLAAVLPHTARAFARAIVMPNLVPPVGTAEAARRYRDRILRALPGGAKFTPLMTCYLTDTTDPDDLADGHRDGTFTAAKLYPAHATTNSADGVTDVSVIRKVLGRMQDIGMPLLVHGEVSDPAVDVFDREAVFIDRVLKRLIEDFPGLRIVFEHVTTRDAVDFVLAHAPKVAATITPHHLMINRNAMFAGGIRPHMYCLPVAKREPHRLALRRAATSGSPAFFLGTDSAPHPVTAKEAECGCAGIFNAPVALECYAQVFAEEGALQRLEAFASLNGPAFYGLPPNTETVTLTAHPGRAPDRVVAGRELEIRPFLAGEPLVWRLEG
jgi:dihydroorotase